MNTATLRSSEATVIAPITTPCDEMLAAANLDAARKMLQRRAMFAIKSHTRTLVLDSKLRNVQSAIRSGNCPVASYAFGWNVIATDAR